MEEFRTTVLEKFEFDCRWKKTVSQNFGFCEFSRAYYQELQPRCASQTVRYKPDERAIQTLKIQVQLHGVGQKQI